MGLSINRKILLVEDDNVAQQIHTYFLKKLNFEIDLVTTGVDALKAVTNTHYVAVILDLGLPDIDGGTVLSEIRKREANTEQRLPIIIVTAHGDPAILNQYKLQNQADGVFTKPVSFLDFKNALEHIAS